MKMLYNGIKVNTDTYNYDINQGGAENLKFTQHNPKCTIIFENGKLKKVIHNIDQDEDCNPVAYWHAMLAIGQKVEELKQSYKQ